MNESYVAYARSWTIAALVLDALSWPAGIYYFLGYAPTGISKMTFLMTTTELLSDAAQTIAAVAIKNGTQLAGREPSGFTIALLYISTITFMITLIMVWIHQFAVRH